MTANELMIGNWVMYKGEPIMVYEIDDYYKRINTEPDGYNAITCIEISDVTPIPLTAEILEKNGFELCKIPEIDYIGWRLSENFSLTVSPASTNDIDGLYWNDDVPIRYVHQLQHALRLCNFEKEIEL